MENQHEPSALVGRLRAAEHQFRLACTVHLAVSNGVQTLDVPMEWTFGRHCVSYEDFGLRDDQADYAAAQLEMTATFVMASTIRDVLVEAFPGTKCHYDPNVVSAYKISRLIRNAFAHSMIDPKWSIDEDCQNKVYEIDSVIRLDTSGINNRYLDWRHYGGPLAIFYLVRYVREVLLQDPISPNREKPDHPTLECYQQGRLILKRVDTIPNGAVLVASVRSGENLELGNGHKISGPVRAYVNKRGADDDG